MIVTDFSIGVLHPLTKISNGHDSKPEKTDKTARIR